MRNITIVGSGPAGLMAAHGLLDAGYHVTVVSDRTADQWRNEVRPTGTAATHHSTREVLRRRGLARYEDVAPEFEGFELMFARKRNRVTTRLNGRIANPGNAIDLRLLCSDWLDEFVAKGGAFEAMKVGVAQLEEFAAQSDLVLLAAGKAQDFADVLTRNPERSVYDKPQRRLAMLNLVNGMEFDLPYRPVRFNAFAEWGEYFWVPYYSAKGGASWSLVIEARPGSPLDRFVGKTRTTQEVLDAARDLIAEVAPSEHAFIKDAQMTDDLGWLCGAFPPTVREPVGTLPSGRHVMPIGDMVMAMDPIGGLGMNNTLQYTDLVIDRIVERGERPYDADWMRAGFEHHYERYGRHAYAFNNALLEPITFTMLQVLLAAGPSSDLSEAFFRVFNAPQDVYPQLIANPAARAMIRDGTRRDWRAALAKGVAMVARNEARQALRGRRLEPPALISGSRLQPAEA